ncbi:MAG: mechanosensitive ion channel [Gammaproteobacteria bacterium]|nr:mechanosensitive ion channel [Gammaproteobacteria bacterium]
MDFDLFNNPHVLLWVFVAASFATSLLVLGLLFKLLAYLQKRRDSHLLLVILTGLKRPLYFFIPVLMVTLFTPILHLKGPLSLIANGTQALTILFFTWLLIKFATVFEAVFEHRCSQGVPSSRNRTMRTQIRFVGRLLIILILIIMVAVFLMTFDNARRWGVGLLTSAGIASVIIGFAAQKTLGGVLAGFQLAFNRMLRIGDGVTVEGVWGQVEEITLTHVIIGLIDNRRLIIPVSYFMDKPYQNWTLSSSEILSDITLYVDYKADIDALRVALDAVLAKQPLWDGRVKTLQVTDMTEKCMIVRILLSGRTVEAVTDLCCIVREALVAYLYRDVPASLPRLRSETMTIPFSSP